MAPRHIATAAALTSLVFGTAGLLVPEGLATAFGLTLDPASAALARLACASYIAFGLLTWLSRELTDPAAWRAVAAADAVAWGLGAAVVVSAMVSGLGDGRLVGLIALQVAFTLAWALVWTRVSALPQDQTASPAR